MCDEKPTTAMQENCHPCLPGWAYPPARRWQQWGAKRGGQRANGTNQRPREPQARDYGQRKWIQGGTWWL